MEVKTYFRDVIAKMKQIQSIDISKIDFDTEGSVEIMKESLLISETFSSCVRSYLNGYYTDALKKTMEKEKMLKDMLSSIKAFTPPSSSKSNAIVKVREYVTEDFEKRGFKCNEITGLPDGVDPWYGHHIEHGRILHKRLNAWLDEEKKKKKEKKEKKEKKANKEEKNFRIVDASAALLSL